MKRFIRGLCALLVLFYAVEAAVIPVCALEDSIPESGQAAFLQEVEDKASDEMEDAVPVAQLEEGEPPVMDSKTEAGDDGTTPVENVEEETLPAESAEEPVFDEITEKPAQDLQAQTEIPLYYQTDYPDNLYGSGTIASSGCSITSLAMVATYLTGHVYLPDELADYFGGYIGNNMERLEYASDMLQLPWKKAVNWHESLKALQEGSVVIALMNQKSAFTNSQHFIVLTGLTEDGKVLVNDPYEPNYTLWNLKDGFANGFPQGYISTGYSGSWIYDKSAMPEEPFIYVEEEEPYVEPRYPEFNLTEEELELLACMVWVEAQGESVEGQQAVAEVVLNRLAADNFPDTLKAVIYAQNQFGSTPFLEDAEPTQTQYEAIERALNGPYVLPMDVVFFAQFPVNKNVWGQIGGHVFCYAW